MFPTTPLTFVVFVWIDKKRHWILIEVPFYIDEKFLTRNVRLAEIDVCSRSDAKWSEGDTDDLRRLRKDILCLVAQKQLHDLKKISQYKQRPRPSYRRCHRCQGGDSQNEYTQSQILQNVCLLLQ